MKLTGIKSLSVGSVALKELYIDNTLMWRSGFLPTGYTQLDYIQSYTTGSWIDTGVYAYEYNDDVLRYNFKGCSTLYQLSGGNNYVFGCLNGGKRSGNLSLRGTTAAGVSFYLGGNSNPQWINVLMPPVNTDFEVDITANSNDVNSVSGYINDSLFERATNAFTSSIMPQSTIYLGHCNGTTTGTSKAFVGKMYYFSIGIKDGELIREFIPCINPDGVVGMYDLVGKAFYTNTSDSGAFTAGNAV